MQYFIGVQLDGSQHVEPLHNCIPEATATESAALVNFSTFLHHFLWILFSYCSFGLVYLAMVKTDLFFRKILFEFRS